MYWLCLYSTPPLLLLLPAVCGVIAQEGTDRNTCTRALWCLANQNFHVSQCSHMVAMVISTVGAAVRSQHYGTPTVDNEALNLLVRYAPFLVPFPFLFSSLYLCTARSPPPPPPFLSISVLPFSSSSFSSFSLHLCTVRAPLLLLFSPSLYCSFSALVPDRKSQTQTRCHILVITITCMICVQCQTMKSAVRCLLKFTP